MLRRKQTNIWKQGERDAARFMKRLGCRILARNLRLSVGEIDLLCQEKQSGTIIVVEVKARSYSDDSYKRIDPVASITEKKKHKLRTLAKAIKRMPEYAKSPIRIDVIGIRYDFGQRKPEITHYPSAVADH